MGNNRSRPVSGFKCNVNSESFPHSFIQSICSRSLFKSRFTVLVFCLISPRNGEQLLLRCLKVILTCWAQLLLHCLNVLVCFTQRRGAAIGAVSGSDHHVPSATPASLFKRSSLFHAETGEQQLSRCLEVILTGWMLLLLHCLNVLVCFTQRRGATIVAMSGGDPHVRSNGFGETGG